VSAPPQDTTQNNGDDAAPSWQEQAAGGEDSHMAVDRYDAGGDQSYDNASMDVETYRPINVKEDG
jgi:hypothetical protein